MLLLTPHSLFFFSPLPYWAHHILFRLTVSISLAKPHKSHSVGLIPYAALRESRQKKKMRNFIPSYPDSFFSCQKAIGLLEMAFLL
jgi:hypothetical protein